MTTQPIIAQVRLPKVEVPPHPTWPPLSTAEKDALKTRIKALMKQQNAVLVAHYYVDGELQALAEETGGCVADSLEMARFGTTHEADTLVVCGVRFMGETSKILNPEKRVLMPDLSATCSLDEGCPAAQFSAFCDAHADHTVVVIDGAIASVGPDSGARIPDGAITIDGGGRYLIPGLAEMHAHVPDPVADGEYLDRVLQLYVANGITLIRGMLGRPGHLDLRDQLAANTRIGPRLITSGPSLNGRSVTSPEEGARMVREQEAAGYDFLKLHPGLSLAAFNAIAAEAKRLGMPFAG